MTDSTPRPRAFWAGWILAGLFLLVAAIAGVYASNLKIQLNDVELRLVDAVTKLQAAEEQLVSAAGESDAIRGNLALLSAPDVVDVKLEGKGAAPEATGRAFISKTRGLLFSATKLPPLPEGQGYELWLLSRSAPVSAGMVRPTPDGNVTAAFDLPADAPATTGVSVTIEPDSGSVSPGTRVVLASR